MRTRHASTVLWLLMTSAAFAQPVPFNGTTIDPDNSGDCKAIGDIDGDGKGDAIIGGASLRWYEAGAGFTPRTIRAQTVYGEFTTDCQAVDLDADGDIDVVIGDGDGPGNVLWFENPRVNAPAGLGSDPRIAANWTYHVIGTHGDTAHDIEVADLDADDRVEVITSGHGFTKIWRRSAAGAWEVKDLSAMAGQGVFLGDIDRDGRPDLATPFGWIRNPGDIISGSWSRFTITGAVFGDECLLMDVNGDGRLDLLAFDAHGATAAYWYEQPATATSPSWTRRIFDPAVGAHHPEVADFNHDGLPDILAGHELGDVTLFVNQGGGAFGRQTIATFGGHNARAGDLDGDSLPDILAADYIGNPPVRIYINDLEDPEPVCYANCDGSATQPLLTANDFACFLTLFASGDPAANCDASISEPSLTANDFLCYLNEFVHGCP